jgi:hypothetical protein
MASTKEMASTDIFTIVFVVDIRRAKRTKGMNAILNARHAKNIERPMAAMRFDTILVSVELVISKL